MAVRKLTVRSRILQKEARSIEGVWRPARKKAPLEPSLFVYMENSFARDFFLATISVIPAAILWVTMENLIVAFALGATIFLSAEYVYPAYRAGRIGMPSARVFSEIRDAIRLRIARRALKA